MKTQTINGVPYLINESGEVFIYSAVPHIHIGNYSADTKVLTLLEGWQTKMAEWTTYYRKQLQTHTQEELEKAVQLQKAT